MGPGLPSKPGILVPVIRGNESWNEYTLEDGTQIRLKPVITEVIRLEGEWDADGNPVYVVKSTAVMSVEAPEGLRKTI